MIAAGDVSACYARNCITQCVNCGRWGGMSSWRCVRWPLRRQACSHKFCGAGGLWEILCLQATPISVGAAEGCDKVGTTFRDLRAGDRLPVDRSLRQQGFQADLRPVGAGLPAKAAYLTPCLSSPPLQAQGRPHQPLLLILDLLEVVADALDMRNRRFARLFRQASGHGVV
jgi:hypothetical protein